MKLTLCSYCGEAIKETETFTNFCGDMCAAAYKWEQAEQYPEADKKREQSSWARYMLEKLRQELSNDPS